MLRKTKERPPEPMTWGRASTVLVVALLFDAFRLFFNLFWLMGPALVTILCTAKVNEVLTTWTAGMLGAKTAALACSAGVVGTITGLTVATGGLSSAAIETFGVMMAMATGLLGWLILGAILFLTNQRIFTQTSGNGLKFASSLLVSEIPFLNALPVMTFSIWRLYASQILHEKKELLAWEAAHAAEIQQEYEQQAAQLRAHLQQAQLTAGENAEFAKQEAVQTESFTEKEIPEKMREPM